MELEISSSNKNNGEMDIEKHSSDHLTENSESYALDSLSRSDARSSENNKTVHEETKH